MHCRRERPDAQSRGLRACAARGTASRVIEASVEHLRRAAHPARAWRPREFRPPSRAAAAQARRPAGRSRAQSGPRPRRAGPGGGRRTVAATRRWIQQL